MSRVDFGSVRFAAFVATVSSVVSAASPAFAHDSWLVAEKSSAPAGATIRFVFATGEVFPVSENAPEPERVAEWSVVRGARVQKMQEVAVEGKELVGRMTFGHLGLYWVGMALKPKFIELKPAEFEEYLKDEHADAALAQYRQRANSDQPGREVYHKFSKTLVTLGATALDVTYTQSVGHKLEIMPLTDPRNWTSGAEVEVKVLLEGRAAAGLHVASGCEGLGPHSYVQQVTTDAAGVARVKFSKGGLWYLRTHVIRALGAPRAVSDAPDAPEAEWESFWTSMTFRVGE